MCYRALALTLDVSGADMSGQESLCSKGFENNQSPGELEVEIIFH